MSTTTPPTTPPTTPWRADAPGRLGFTHAQTVTATATHPDWDAPLELGLETGSTLSFDEARAPRCVADLMVRAPIGTAGAALLDALDPRTGVRIHLEAGYLWPDGVDAHAVADLQLRDRRVVRPGDRLSLTAWGGEAAVIDAGGPGVDTTLASASITAAAVDLLTQALGAAPVVVESSLPAVPPVTDEDTPSATVGQAQDWWAALDDIVDRAAAAADVEGGDVFHDGLTGWHLVTRPALAAPAHELVVGQRGTVLTSDAALTRQGWANTVQVRYAWEDIVIESGIDPEGHYYATRTVVPRLLYGQAQVTTGPRRPELAGRVVHRETRQVRTDQSAADAVAAALLARKLAAGRTLALDAISAWWLRPGHTVATRLLTGPAEDHLVAAVTFDLTAGRMAVRTRRPDDDATISQGA